MNINWKIWCQSWYLYTHQAVYRVKQLQAALKLGLPIPGLGVRSRYGQFRQPRCRAVNGERLFTYEENKEYNFKKIKQLPDSYDDKNKTSNYNDNWKRYRKHQWKEKKCS